MRNILIVDDEKNIRKVLRAYLEKEKFNVFEASNGMEALEKFYEKNIHLILLDVMMPRLNGIETLKEIRKNSKVPIIFLTAKVEEEDVIKGIDLGADDYVRKPYSVKEVMIRVKALIRRTYTDESKIKLENLIIDTENMTIEKNSEIMKLTTNEFKILQGFLDNKNQILTRTQIIEASFGMEFEGFERTIDVHIKNLRKKMENDPKNPKYIKTIYGAGYRLEIGE